MKRFTLLLVLIPISLFSQNKEIEIGLNYSAYSSFGLLRDLGQKSSSGLNFDIIYSLDRGFSLIGKVGSYSYDNNYNTYSNWLKAEFAVPENYIVSENTKREYFSEIFVVAGLKKNLFTIKKNLSFGIKSQIGYAMKWQNPYMVLEYDSSGYKSGYSMAYLKSESLSFMSNFGVDLAYKIVDCFVFRVSPIYTFSPREFSINCSHWQTNNGVFKDLEETEKLYKSSFNTFSLEIGFSVLINKIKKQKIF